MKSLTHLLEYYSLLCVRLIVKYLPGAVVYRIGRFLGYITYTTVGIRKKTVMDNLAMAFPDKPAQWLAGIARETYQLSGAAMLEFLKLPEIDRKYIDTHIRIHGLEHLDTALKKGNGVILGGGHFGNWEWTGAVFPILGYSTHYVMIEQHNTLVHALVNKFRMMKGIQCIPTGTGTKEIIRCLRQNEMVCMLYDQDARKQGIFVDFFGRPASTHGGLGLFTWKTGAALLTVYMIRSDSTQFDMYIDPPIFADQRLEKDDAILDITRRITSRLEEMVRKYPAHWFWYHRRWKTIQKK